MAKSQIALLAFGANQPFGNSAPAQTILSALATFPKVDLAEPRLSRLFTTPCFPAGAGPDYVNAAGLLEVPADLGAQDLLARLHQIEARFGRKRAQRWGMRTLDIDLLALGDQILPDIVTQRSWQDLAPHLQKREMPDQLILPHPRLQDRPFVLVPLMDVAPDWCHPVQGQTITQMLRAFSAEEIAEIQPVSAASA